MKNSKKNNILKIASFILVSTILFVSLEIKSVNASGDVGSCCATGHTSTGDPCGCGDPGDGGGGSPPPCYPSCGGNCTLPACPSGYITTNYNNYCSSDTRSVSCTYGNGCGGTCGKTGTCFRAETNTELSAPTYLSITLDGIVYPLSTNPSSPTRIKLPSINASDNQILLKVLPTISPNIAINRGVGYIVRANNYGVNNEWSAWNDCSNSRPEDFCKESGTSSNGNISYSGDYTIHTFTSSGTFVSSMDMNVDVLVVAGGGGGGYDAGGGGGGGGVIYRSNLPITQGSYTVTVGEGGAGSASVGGRGSNGGNSSFGNIVVAYGGGGGGSKNNSGLQGGSGGGGGHLNNMGAAGISGQGNAGGTASNTRGGGGGGASGIGASGVSSGNGGTGYLSSISGISQYYGGGGAGGNHAGAGGVGGAGGGGNGGNNSGYSGSEGIPNTGGGGGANGNIYSSGGTGKKGGSGIVIIRYRTPETAITPNVFTFTPTSLSAKNVLKEGATGSIGALYYSVNRCDDGRKYSPVRQTYYKVNQLPTLTTTPVVNKTDSVGDTTITTKWNDPDGDSLRGIVAWFTTNGNTYTQKVTSITSSAYTGTNESDIGIMILSDKKIYLLNNDRSTWSYAGTNSAVIKNTSNENILSISNITTTSGSNGTYSFKISPIDGTKTSFCSTYTFYTTAIDNYMIVNAGDAGNYNITTGTQIDHTKMASTGITRKFETNSLPTLPSVTGSLIIDGITYPRVSTNSTSPTVVKYPSADNVTTYQPESATKPTGARQITITLNPSTFPRSIFPAGQTKTITETYNSQNRCDDNWLSTSRTVYYKTNNPPTVDNSDDPDCSMVPDAQCTTSAILDDIGGSDSYTKVGTDPNGGCFNTTHTGIEANNPLKISIEAKDPDQNNEIKGAIVWFSKTSAPQTMITRTSTYTHTNPNNIGVMILDNKAYAITYDSKWAPITDNMLRKENGEELARITDISTTDQGTSKKISFKITLNSTNTTNPDGKYSVDILVLDTYLINPEWIDQSFIKHYFNWYFDLTKPSVDSFKHTIIDMQRMNVIWSLSDAQTNIKEYVINAYRSDKSAINTSITIDNNPNQITLNEGTPPEEQIGNPRNPNQWDYLNVNTTPVNVSSQIDISTNEGGSIDMYLTAFDQACNYTTSSNNSVNLDPWISTKGGTLYSQGNILTNAKDLSSVDDLYYTISGLPTIKNATKYQLKIGSEVISSGSDFIRNVIESNKTSVRATNIVDTNDRVDEYYETFKKNLNRKQEGVVQIDSINGCPSGGKCIMYSTEDITIPSGMVCDKSILFMTEGSIFLNPNIVGDNNGLHGCIFVAKQDINILEGDYRSTSVVGYDYIEGFMYAGNQVKIPFADAARVLRDGVEIYGGVVAMGNDLTHNGTESGVSQARNLRLFNDINPALVVVYDNKYSKISEIFFGKEAAIFKREVGYKPY